MLSQGFRRFQGYAWSGPMFLYSLQDRGTNARAKEDWFGVLRADGSRKPAFAALQKALGSSSLPVTAPTATPLPVTQPSTRPSAPATQPAQPPVTTPPPVSTVVPVSPPTSWGGFWRWLTGHHPRR